MARDYNPNAMQAVMAEGFDRVRGVGQMRTAAELAARDFDRIPSPNAQYWAQQLRADPEGAFRASQQYGGIGNVEQALRSAYARGAAVRAATPEDMQSVLFQESPEDWLTFQQGRLADARAIGELRSSTALQPEDYRGLRSGRAKTSEDYGDLFRAYRMARQANPGDKEWGQALTILFNKVLQPDSAVLQGEAESTARSLMSMMEQLGVTVEGIYQPQTPLSEEAARRMLGVIDDLAEVGLNEYVDMQDRWELENVDMQIPSGSPRDYQTRPGYRRVSDIEDELAGIRDRRQAGGRNMTEQERYLTRLAKDAPEGGIVVTLDDGRRARLYPDGTMEDAN